MAQDARPRGPRNFDPVAVGRQECAAWASYYRREWRQFLVAAVGMVRAGFVMSWPRTVLGAWWVLRANQAWAPYPGNDPDGAREYMRRFYTLVDVPDPAHAARLEVEWWRVHRLHQREDAAGDSELITALVDLYAYVYDASPDAVRPAAEHRAEAMRLSDEWVTAGCSLEDPRLAVERRELVASYSALRDAVGTA
jgi:hypothetical protein